MADWSGRPDMTDDAAAFGPQLRAHRLDARLSQQELAERSGLSVRAISNLEGGYTRRPYQNSVQRLADALGLSAAARREFAAAAERRLGRLAQALTEPRESARQPADEAVAESESGRPPAHVVPRQLPPPVAAFVGREDVLAELTRLADRSTETAGIVVISGTAGVGKTAVAVRWAHQVAEGFPDGQLYVDLRGYGADRPMPATDALAGFLRALGVAGPDIPAEAEERAALFRSRTAGRRMLVLLDNAGRVEQVRPLLPGGTGCVVAATSRDSLAGLVARDGAVRVELDVLAPGEAAGLLRALVGDRVNEDPGAAATLADRCCRLPLALRVAAELAAERPARSLAGLAAELGDLQHRLDALDADGDRGTAMRTVFSWSYRNLPTDAARAFRLAALHPGTDLDGYAAAALTGTDLQSARRLLDRLARAHLVQTRDVDRHGMHDLLRAYALELCDADEDREDRRAALTRLYDYYLTTTSTAVRALYPSEANRQPEVPAPSGPAPEIPDSDAARAWLDAERANLVAAVIDMAEADWPGHAVRMSPALSRYLDSDYMPEAVLIHGHALQAAARTGSAADEATALRNLGNTAFRQGRYQQAADYYRPAIALFARLGREHDLGRTVHNLGTVERHQGDLPRAVGHFEQALELSRRVGDWPSEARALSSLAVTFTRQGRYADATELLHRNLALFRAARARDGGRPDSLISCGESGALTYLGVVEMRQGRYRRAAQLHRRALAVYDEVGENRGRVEAMTNLGILELRQGLFPRAAEHLEQARAMSRDIGDRHCEADALVNLGLVELRRGFRRRAAELLDQALAQCRELGHRLGEAEALAALGELLLAEGRPDQAGDRYKEALDLAGLAHDVELEDRARRGLDAVLAATGDVSGEPEPRRMRMPRAATCPWNHRPR
jgi:tetratricopeptide (TPR) repeat protein